MPTSIPAFAGFSTPHYTMVPDQLFDELLPTLSGAELKVLLYITRRTFGFKKDSDAISLNQIANGITTTEGRVLDQGTGLSKSTVAQAVTALEAKGVVVRHRQSSTTKGDEATTYALRFEHPTHQAPTPVRKSDTHPCPKIGHPPVRKSDTQETVVQETEYSNIRKEKFVREKEASDDPYAETTLIVEEVSHPLPLPGEQPSHSMAAGMPVLHTPHPPASVSPTARDTIMQRIEQFAAEFHDQATLKSSTSRAYNLLTRSGVSIDCFVSCLWEARSIVRERVKTGQGKPILSQMSYFFSVLHERLGLISQIQGGYTAAPVLAGR